MGISANFQRPSGETNYRRQLTWRRLTLRLSPWFAH
jgi:hypothetical protein